MPNNSFEERILSSIQKRIPNQTSKLYISTAINSRCSMKYLIKKESSGNKMVSYIFKILFLSVKELLVQSAFMFCSTLVKC